MPKLYGQACPVAKSLELVGERWTLLVVRDLLRGPRRFQDLQDSLTGIAPNILSDRLKLMEQHALVERRFYSDHPPRAEYVLTEKGQELAPVVSALASWGTRFADAPTRYIHTTCGTPVELTLRCPHCTTNLDPDEVRLDRTPAPA
jgi:DNA-binding HxlR family transcriptional regulator